MRLLRVETHPVNFPHPRQLGAEEAPARIGVPFYFTDGNDKLVVRVGNVIFRFTDWHGFTSGVAAPENGWLYKVWMLPPTKQAG